MPVQFLGMGATNDGSETHPRSGRQLRQAVHAAPGPGPRGDRLGPGAHRLRLGPARPGPGGGLHRQQRRAPPAAARPPAEPVDPDVRGQDVRHARPDQRRPAHRPLHHRRQRPRAAARGRLPHQGRPLLPHAGVHPDRQAGVDEPRAVRPRGRALPLRRLRERRVPGAAAPPERVVRRVVAGRLRRRRGRGRHLLPVGRAAGRDGRADRVGQGGRRRRRPDRAAAVPGRLPSDPRRHRGAGVGEGPRHRGGHRPRGGGPGRRRSCAARPARPENTGSQRLVALAERGDRYDRALWTATAAATGGAGNSNALVGTPETVAAALLDYYDLGIEILSARGYDMLEDAVEFGRAGDPDRPRGGRQARPGARRRCAAAS